MPSGGRQGPAAQRQIPIGLDNIDLLPCGCREEDAIFEQWMVGTDAYNKRRQTGAKAGWIAVSLSSFHL